jgi:hypothetical protein
MGQAVLVTWSSIGSAAAVGDSASCFDRGPWTGTRAPSWVHPAALGPIWPTAHAYYKVDHLSAANRKAVIGATLTYLCPLPSAAAS